MSGECDHAFRLEPLFRGARSAFCEALLMVEKGYRFDATSASAAIGPRGVQRWDLCVVRTSTTQVATRKSTAKAARISL